MDDISESAPGRLLLRFLLPKSLTREKTLSLLGFSHGLLALLGLLVHRQTFDFSRSLACLFWRMRELAIAAAIATLPPETRRDLGVRARAPQLLRLLLEILFLILLLLLLLLLLF